MLTIPSTFYVFSGTDILSKGDTVCGRFTTIAPTMVTWTGCMMIVLVVQQHFAIGYPRGMTKYCTTTKLLISCVRLVLVSLVVNISICDYFKELVICTGAGLYVTVYAVIPIISLIPCNITLIYHMRKAKQVSNGRDIEEQGINNGNLISILVLIASTTFITFILLYMFRTCYEFTEFTESSELLSLTTRLTYMLVYTNHSIKLLLHCASGSLFPPKLLALWQCPNTTKEEDQQEQLPPCVKG